MRGSKQSKSGRIDVHIAALANAGCAPSEDPQKTATARAAAPPCSSVFCIAGILALKGRGIVREPVLGGGLDSEVGCFKCKFALAAARSESESSRWGRGTHAHVAALRAASKGRVRLRGMLRART